MKTCFEGTAFLLMKPGWVTMKKVRFEQLRVIAGFRTS